MQILTTTVARVLYALPLLVFGLMHLGNASAMAGMVPIPGGVFWVYLTGIALIAAAVSLVIRKYDRLAGLLLGVMLLIFAFTIHLPGVINAADEGAMAASMSSLLKDTALAGAAFLMAGLGNGGAKS